MLLQTLEISVEAAVKAAKLWHQALALIFGMTLAVVPASGHQLKGHDAVVQGIQSGH